MLTKVYRIIEAAVGLDKTLSEEDRDGILAICRNPRKMSPDNVGTVSKLLTAPEVGELLQVSRATVWRMVATGGLQPVRIGKVRRFRLDDVRRYLESSRAAPSDASDRTGEVPPDEPTHHESKGTP